MRDHDVLGNDKVVLLTKFNKIMIIKIEPNGSIETMMDMSLLQELEGSLETKDLLLCPANDFIAVSFVSQTSPTKNKIVLYKISKRGLITPSSAAEAKAKIVYSAVQVQQFNIPCLSTGFSSLAIHMDLGLPLYKEGKLILAVFNEGCLSLYEFCPQLMSMKQIFEKDMEGEFFSLFRGFGFGSLAYVFGVDNERLHRLKIK